MSLKEWIMNPCSECRSPVETLFSFNHPYPVAGWKLCEVHYQQCTSCNTLFIGEYSEGKVSGKCWGRSQILRVHQLEGFIDEAYWMYGYDQPVEEPLEECI